MTIDRARRVMEAMDSLLANAEERGREPWHLIVSESDWLAIGEHFRDHLFPDPAARGEKFYRGIPVQLRSVTDDQLAALVDSNGEQTHA